MALLKSGCLLPNNWHDVADDAPLPDDAPAMVTLARLLHDAEALAVRIAPLGVRLPPEADPAKIAPYLGRLSVVVLRFPKHRDGRAFTQARTLRERYAFTGEIWAAGHVLPDQYAFLLRCGVDTVEIAEGSDPAEWQRGLGAIHIAYQPAVARDGAPIGLLRRHVGVG